MENERIIIQIEGIESKVEKITSFHNSYFRQEYLRAFRTLTALVDMAPQKKDGKWPTDEFYNLIGFIGERGTGKTSAMKSFMESLSDIKELLESSKSDNAFQEAAGELANYYFFTLPCIDGSLLESNEEIIKITLAQMYGELIRRSNCQQNQFSERSIDYEKRELQIKFENLYSNACKLDINAGMGGESSIISLKNLSNSLQIRRDFRDLVFDYLNLMRKLEYRDCGNREPKYLVISIDDLDMNISSGYEMLEKIHRYLMVPGVIVLMTLDFPQLKMLCDNNFYGMVPRVNKILKNRLPIVQKVSQEYLDKVLPIGSRVYMPDFKRRNNLNIIPFNSTPNDAIELKRYFFREIYNKTGIRLDCYGTKWHFYIPESMRSLVNFYMMLRQIVDLDENINSGSTSVKWWWDRLDRNHTYFIADIKNRMVDEKLDHEQRENFIRFTDNQIYRSCMQMVGFVYNLAKKGSTAEKNYLEHFANEYEIYKYSYGELLRSIYLLGRTNDAGKQQVHCMLAYLTDEMTNVYYKMLREEYTADTDVEIVLQKNKKDKEKSREYLTYVLNGSVFGSWSNKILPGVVELGQVATIPLIDMQYIRFKMSVPEVDLNRFTNTRLLRTKDALDAYKRIFRTIEFISLFFSEQEYKNTGSMSWKIVKKSEDNDELAEQYAQDDFEIAHADKNSNAIELTFEKGYCSFNMYNFASNLFDWEKKSDAIEHSVCEVFFQGIDTKQHEKIIEMLGVQEEITKWKKQSAGFVLPFYDLDVVYNIAKRLRQDRYGKMAEVQEVEEVYSAFKNSLEKLLKRLRENDDYYGIKDGEKEIGTNGVLKSYAERFKECPFYKWISNPKRYLVKDYEKILYHILRIIGNNGSTGPIEIDNEFYSSVVREDFFEFDVAD